MWLFMCKQAPPTLLFVLWDHLAKIKSYFAHTNNKSYLFLMHHQIIKNFSFYSIPLRNSGENVAQARNHKIPNFPFMLPSLYYQRKGSWLPYTCFLISRCFLQETSSEWKQNLVLWRKKIINSSLSNTRWFAEWVFARIWTWSSFRECFH